MSILQNLNYTTQIFLAAGVALAVIAVLLYYATGLNTYRRSMKTSREIRENKAFGEAISAIPKKAKESKTLTEEDMEIGIEGTTRLDLVGAEATAKLDAAKDADELGEDFAENVLRSMVERSERSFPEDSLVWGGSIVKVNEIVPDTTVNTTIKVVKPREIPPNRVKTVKKNKATGGGVRPQLSARAGAFIATGTLVLLALHHQRNRKLRQNRERRLA